MDEYKKAFIGALAGLFGWVVVAISKIQAQKITWGMMMAHIGVALLVGFTTLSLLPHVGLAHISTSLSVAIASVAGSIADQVIVLFQNIVQRLIGAIKFKEQTGDDEAPKNN